jgi:thiol-disulfide isomerase/thioredoxin
MSQESAPRRGNLIWLFVVVAGVGLASIGFAYVLQKEDVIGKGPPRGGLEPGKPLPAIEADGWLNGAEPTPASLKGKVLVIDAWEYWCGPCRAEAPHLVQAYEQFHDRGVVFIGLASEPKSKLQDMQQFIEETGIRWPCAYGATSTLIALQTEGIPQVWVVGADGIIHWNMDSPGALDDAIEEALANAKVVDTPKKPR